MFCKPAKPRSIPASAAVTGEVALAALISHISKSWICREVNNGVAAQRDAGTKLSHLPSSGRAPPLSLYGKEHPPQDVLTVSTICVKPFQALNEEFFFSLIASLNENHLSAFFQCCTAFSHSTAQGITALQIFAGFN